jgi:hypothetical protein
MSGHWLVLSNMEKPRIILHGNFALKIGHEGPQASRTIVVFFFNHDSRRKWVVNPTPRPLNPRETDPASIVQEAG